MKTLLLSTLTQQILFTIAATIFFVVTTTDAQSFQISFFALAIFASVVPTVVFNLIGLGVLKLVVNHAKSSNPKRAVLLTAITYGLAWAIFCIALDVLSFKYKTLQWVGLISYFSTMSLILHYFYAKDHENDINSMQKDG